jgi:ligand-binding sensor protein
MENRAKINDRWVKKGEVINGLKLVKITSKSAVLANSQRTLTLTLSQKGNRNVVITSN